MVPTWELCALRRHRRASGDLLTVSRKELALTPTVNALAGAAILAAAAIAMHVVYRVDCDDSYIHLRIAQNWASGLGPVFNAGERVEASTSPVWLALLTFAIRLGLPGLTVAWVLAVLAAAGCGAGTAVLARRIAGPRMALVAPLLLVTQIPYLLWNAMPMEHGLAACVLVWAVIAGLATKGPRSAAVSGLLAALAAMIRPEALVLVPILVGVGIASAPRAHLAKVATAAIACAIVPLVALLAWRYSFYGEFVPNTYVAKVQGLPLMQRFQNGALYLGQFLLFESIILGLAGWCAARGGRDERIVALLCAAFLAGVVSTGGDWFPYVRLMVPIFPLVCVLAAGGLARVERHPVAWIGAALVLQLVLSTRPKEHQLFRIKLLRIFVDDCGLIGESLLRLPPGAFATESIGIIGYLDPSRPILDLVGLADAHIARSPHIPGILPGHDHSDVTYVLGRAPALVMPYSWPRSHPIDDAEELAYLAENHDSWAAGEALVRDARFRTQYEAYDFVLNDGEHLRLWRRRDFVIP
jgi:hypothetical protein